MTENLVNINLFESMWVFKDNTKQNDLGIRSYWRIENIKNKAEKVIVSLQLVGGVGFENFQKKTSIEYNEFVNTFKEWRA